MTKKLIVEIEDELHKRMLNYIANNSPRGFYGQNKKIVSKAINEFLEKRDY